MNVYLLGWLLFSLLGVAVSGRSFLNAMQSVKAVHGNGVVLRIAKDARRREALRLTAQSLFLSVGIVAAIFPSPPPQPGRAVIAFLTSGVLVLVQGTIVLNSYLDIRAVKRSRVMAMSVMLASFVGKSVLEGASHGLTMVADSTGRFQVVSKSWEQALGYPREVLEGSRWSDLVHPDDLDKTMAEHQRMLDGHDVNGFRNRYRRIDGTYVTLEWDVPQYDHGLTFGAARVVDEGA